MRTPSCKMSESSSLVGFLSEPSTLLALGAVAVGAAWYLNSSTEPTKPPVPLENQSLEVKINVWCVVVTFDLTQTEQYVRRSHFAKDGLITYCFEDVTTLYENFKRGVSLSGEPLTSHTHVLCRCLILNASG